MLAEEWMICLCCSHSFSAMVSPVPTSDSDAPSNGSP